jgi:putative ABC transport system permease protein
VEALAALDGVAAAEGAWSEDVLSGDGENQKVLHMESISEVFNLPTVTEGRLPETEGECLLDSAYADSNEIALGDIIKIKESGEDGLLLTDQFTVVGFGQSPLYISFNRGNTTLGSGEVNGFALVLPENFDQEVYTQIYLKVHGSDQLISYTDAYDDLIDRAEEQVEGIEAERCAYRYSSIVEDAKEELRDGEQEFYDARQDAQKELSDAREELLDGEKEYEDGLKEYREGQQELADGKAQLEDGKTQLESARKELEDGKTQLESAKAQVSSTANTLDEKQAEIDAGWEQIASAQAEVDAGRQELEEGIQKLADGKEAIAEAEATLNEKQTELTAGQAAIAEGKSQIAAGREQIEETKTTLAQRQSEVDAGLSSLAQGEAEAAAGRSALNEAGASLSEQRSQLEAAREAGVYSEEEYAALNAQLSEAESNYAAQDAQLSATEQSLAANRSQLESAQAQIQEGQSQIESQSAALTASEQELAAKEAALPEAQAQIDAGWQELESQKQALEPAEAEIAASTAKLDAAQAEIDANRQTLLDGQAQIDAGRSQLSAAQAEITANEKKLTDGEAEIKENEQKLADSEKTIKESEEKLADASAELIDARRTLKDGWHEYEEGRQEAIHELSEAQEELADAKEEIRKIEKPEWYVTNRSDLPEYSDYGDNADRIRNIGKVFPAIFFLVAALISLTTMTRMVEDERTQIGTLKALGYSKWDIAGKYLRYAFLATVGGSIFGVLLGEKLLPWIIITAYGIMYHNVSANLVIDYEWQFALLASGLAVVCTIGATLFSCYKELAETPASLMRPPAPKEGRRILLERIPILWKHLNFTWKSSMRNLFRYKKRLFMTIFGIAGSMGLLLVGYGIQDSIMDIATIQYSQLQHYDGTIIHDEDATYSQVMQLLDFLEENEKIERYTQIELTKMTVSNGHSHLSTYVYVPEDLENFAQDVTLKNRITGERYSLSDEGAVICEKTATLLGLSIGDNITIQRDNKNYQVPIAVITENYMGHYIYMTPKVYEETFGETPEFVDTVFTVKPEYAEEIEEIGSEILNCEAALSISYTASLAGQIERMLSTLNLVVIVLIVSAGMLAFVVLYNLNNINITERQRELATLKVLGFYDMEVSSYVFRENVVLTFIGIVAGAFLGIALHRYIITTVEVDAVMFGRSIKPISFLYCALFTCGFSAIVNFFMHRKLKKIDMVESLKSVE